MSDGNGKEQMSRRRFVEKSLMGFAALSAAGCGESGKATSDAGQAKPAAEQGTYVRAPGSRDQDRRRIEQMRPCRAESGPVSQRGRLHRRVVNGLRCHLPAAAESAPEYPGSLLADNGLRFPIRRSVRDLQIR